MKIKTNKKAERREAQELAKACSNSYDRIINYLLDQEEKLGVVPKRDILNPVDTILQITCNYFVLTQDQLLWERGRMVDFRDRPKKSPYDISYIPPRAIAMYLLYHFSPLSLKQIGRLFHVNGVHLKHSGTYHAVVSVINWIESNDKTYGKAANTLIRYCRSRMSYRGEKFTRLWSVHKAHVERFYENEHN